MTKEELLGIYRSRPMLTALVAVLDGPDRKNFRLTGLSGSVLSLIGAASSSMLERPFLFILPDYESAAYFLNDLESLLG
ncbi:MAG: hypothetical protein ACKOQ6_10175, partial [Bacteroidota bacterium]